MSGEAQLTATAINQCIELIETTQNLELAIYFHEILQAKPRSHDKESEFNALLEKTNEFITLIKNTSKQVDPHNGSELESWLGQKPISLYTALHNSLCVLITDKLRAFVKTYENTQNKPELSIHFSIDETSKFLRDYLMGDKPIDAVRKKELDQLFSTWLAQFMWSNNEGLIHLVQDTAINAKHNNQTPVPPEDIKNQLTDHETGFCPFLMQVLNDKKFKAKLVEHVPTPAAKTSVTTKGGG